MKHFTWLAALLTIAAFATLGGGVALAHGQKIAVEPASAKPDEAITVKGEGLGHHSEVEVRLLGAGVDIDLGEVNADIEGDFVAQFRVPANVKPGTYQIQAKGAETAMADLTVLAPGAAGSTAAESSPAPILRERPLPESIGLVALFGALAALGLFLARTVRREAPVG